MTNAFDPKNKVSKRELTPELRLEIEGKLSAIEFGQHASNNNIHVTKELQDNWNDAYIKITNLTSPETGIEKMLDDLINSLAAVAKSGKFSDLIEVPSTFENTVKINGIRITCSTTAVDNPVNDKDIWYDLTRKRWKIFTGNAWSLMGGVWK